MVKLSQYIEENCINMRALSKKIGISHATLARICQGHEHTLSIALAIERATDGKVTVYDLEPTIGKKRGKQTKKETTK